MDMFNFFVLEIFSKEAVRERLRTAQPVAPRKSAASQRSGVKRALAATLVRLGLRLDPAAGEGLAAPNVPLTRQEAGQRA